MAANSAVSTKATIMVRLVGSGFFFLPFSIVSSPYCLSIPRQSFPIVPPFGIGHKARALQKCGRLASRFGYFARI